MLIRSRIVLPVSGPPIANGAVALVGERIAAVGSWSELRRENHGEVIDLGETILLPGLINAHCHLDYTDMAGQLAATSSFSGWIKEIVALKAAWSYTEFAQSWLAGAGMLLRSGTTTVVNIEAIPELVAEAAATTPLRIAHCLEIISIRRARSPHAVVEDAARRLADWGVAWVGLSPHAPYTTSSDLLRQAAEKARENHWLLTTHVAESHEEAEMFQHQRGPMFEWLKFQRDMSDCGLRSPVEHLHAAGVLGPNFLAVHANCVSERDAHVLAKTGTSVAHCPRSHDYFAHDDFPFARLRGAGVNICLGTDSLATVSRNTPDGLTLNLFAEMRAFLRKHPGVDPEQILRLVTTGAARAVGRPGELGELSAGAAGDLIALLYSGGMDDAYGAVLQHQGDVHRAWIRGRQVFSGEPAP